jgi:2-polyprenyl-3-methyl-5-hydroxy-6-metoxy-1,4-benzoquinol methylase
MAALGWQVAGLDSSPDAVRNVREQLGLEAYLGSLPHPALAPCSFEVVTMWHALEHVHQPLRILREAYRLLVPGGCLVVAVPNFDSHTRAWFGEHWFGLDLPRHLTHFTAETLGSMLLAAGFQARTLRGLSHAGWVRASARRACAAGVGGVRGNLLRRRPVARMAAWLNYLSSGAESLVAVCERTS